MESITPTSTSALDKMLKRLSAAKDRFASLPIADRMNLIDACVEGLNGVQDAWVAAACDAKGLPQDAPLAGEEWLAGPMVTQRNLRLLRQSLMDIRDYGAPRLREGAVSTSASGQTVAQVFPASGFDKLLFQGFTAEVWMEPGVTPETLKETMALAYAATGETPKGKVALVLGAGNVASIGPMDVLYKLFAENEVCLLKMNPVNAYIGPFVEQAFKALVDADFLGVVYGGADVGDYLCKHSDVDSIHITGSNLTHDMIVWGAPGAARDARMAAGTPENSKPITSELGCVTPVVVVPGPYSASDLAFQAQNVAAMVANNGSFNCNAAKMVILQEEWPQKEAFVSAVESALAQTPARKAYYPGAEGRYQRFLEAVPTARPAGKPGDGVVPWTLLPGIDATDQTHICFTTEAFCGVLGQTALSADSPKAFLEAAVAFCNDTMWGTLSCSLIVHPKTHAAPGMAEAVERAIADLRYGTVALNHWPALAYGFCTTTWGAFPGHPNTDIQSGAGVVHNTYLFDRPQKTVVRGPFKVFPKPAWFASNKRTHKLGARLTRFEAAPSVLKVPGILFNAILG